VSPGTSAERTRLVWRDALAQFATQLEGRPDSYADAWWWRTFRASLLAAGATAVDIEAVAERCVCWVVERTEPGSAQRREQVQWIGEHLAETPMVVRISTDDASMSITFPSRPRVH